MTIRGKRKIRVILGWSALGTAGALLLSGCGPEAPIAARIVDGGLVIVVCQDFEAERVLLTTQPLDDLEQTEQIVWEARGDASIASGQQLSVGEEIAGMSSDPADVPLPVQRWSYAFSLQTLDDDNEPETALNAIFDGGDLSDDRWLDQNGHLRDSPC